MSPKTKAYLMMTPFSLMAATAAVGFLSTSVGRVIIGIVAVTAVVVLSMAGFVRGLRDLEIEKDRRGRR